MMTKRMSKEISAMTDRMRERNAVVRQPPQEAGARRYACRNMSGSVTGTGIATQQPDGSWRCTAAFGSSFAGGVCDDGPKYRKTVASEEEADAWMRGHRMHPANI